jgi:hypothetical protein
MELEKDHLADNWGINDGAWGTGAQEDIPLSREYQETYDYDDLNTDIPWPKNSLDASKKTVEHSLKGYESSLAKQQDIVDRTGLLVENITGIGLGCGTGLFATGNVLAGSFLIAGCATLKFINHLMTGHHSDKIQKGLHAVQQCRQADIDRSVKVEQCRQMNQIAKTIHHWEDGKHFLFAAAKLAIGEITFLIDAVFSLHEYAHHRDPHPKTPGDTATSNVAKLAKAWCINAQEYGGAVKPQRTSKKKSRHPKI